MLSKNKKNHGLKRLTRNAFVTVTTALIAVALSGCYLFPDEVVVLEPPLKTPPQVTYDFMEAKRTTIETKVTGSGTFESISKKSFFFESDQKRMKEIYVKAGDDVAAGDLLAELDTDDVLTRIKNQESAIKKSEISYNQLVNTSKLDIERSKLELDSLKKDYERMTAIPEATPKAELEDIQRRIRLQEISHQKLLETNSTGENGKIGSALQLSQISLNEQRAVLTELKQELNSYRLYSTIPGKVYYVDSSVKPGDRVAAYSTIVTVADPTKLQLVYTGDRANQFNLGSEVEVLINSNPYKGIIVMTPSSMPEDASHELKGKVVIDVPENPSDAKIGTPATIKLVIDKRENVIAIPKHLVKNVDGRSIVYVLNDNIRSERAVQTGLQTETQWEIVSGLEEGEQVIVK